MTKRRAPDGRRHRPPTTLCRGPGNLTRALGITLADNRLDLVSSRLVIEDRGLRCRRCRLGTAHRHSRRRRNAVAVLGRRAIPPCRSALRGAAISAVPGRVTIDAYHMGKTLLQKVWDLHTVRQLPTGQTQLFIGLHLVHEVTTPAGVRHAARARLEGGASRSHLRHRRSHRPDARAHAAVPRRAWPRT